MDSRDGNWLRIPLHSSSGFYRNFFVTPVTIWRCALIDTKLIRQLQEFLGTERLSY